MFPDEVTVLEPAQAQMCSQLQEATEGQRWAVRLGALIPSSKTCQISPKI